MPLHFSDEFKLNEYRKAFNRSYVVTEAGDPILIRDILQVITSDEAFDQGFEGAESYSVQTRDQVGFLEVPVDQKGPTPNFAIRWKYPGTYQGAVNFPKAAFLVGRNGLRLWKKGLTPDGFTWTNPFQEECKTISRLVPDLQPLSAGAIIDNIYNSRNPVTQSLLKQVIKGPDFSPGVIEKEFNELLRGKRATLAIGPRLITGPSLQTDKLEIRLGDKTVVGYIKDNKTVELDDDYEPYLNEIMEAGFDDVI